MKPRGLLSRSAEGSLTHASGRLTPAIDTYSSNSHNTHRPAFVSNQRLLATIAEVQFHDQEILAQIALLGTRYVSLQRRGGLED
jgi:hypothetical protein